MGNKIMLKKIDLIIIGFIIICPFFKGLYFYHTIYFFGAIILFITMMYIKNNKVFLIEKSINHYCILIGVVLYFITIFYAIDKGMAFMGFFKVLVAYLFYLMIMQSQINKKIYMKSISVSGIIISFISILSFFIPSLSKEFLQKGRLGSFFQYPNTFALFLIVCIIFIIGQEKNKYYYNILGISFMWACILLTFSRSMYIISLGTIITCIIYNKKKFKSILMAFGIGTGIWYFIMTSSSLSNVFNRIQETSTKTSEWLTRLLYYKDSFTIMKHYPFGTGHLGYYYIQRIYQTGATYYVKYIHSNVLQIVMDIGIIGFLLVVIFFINNTFSKNLSFYEKLAVVVIFGHGAIDFDWQFLVVGFLIILIINKDNAKMKTLNIPRKLIFFVGLIIISIYGYMGVGSYYAYIEDYEKSLSLYPYNTEAKIKLVKKYKDEDKDRAYTLAEEIISRNKFATYAFITKRDIDYENKNFMEAYKSAKRIIYLNPLNINHVEIYASIVLERAKKYIEEKDIQSAIKELEKILAIPYYMDGLAKDRLTDYNVKHIPRLFMTEKLIDIYEEADKLLENVYYN
ncbi:MAG: O-antigen ligase family protein [Vallitalea sp.]|nr:O-antigen ligase family protein [Vallitalea sp.]